MSHRHTRVRKACDRCRLKKGKCDGHFPCNRCKGDDSVCAYSRKKINRDRVYARSYVDLLERQRWQLVAGIHSMHQRLREASAVPNMDETPDIHTVLCSLGLVNERMGYDETCSEVAEDDGETIAGGFLDDCDTSPAPLSDRELSPVSVLSIDSNSGNTSLPTREELPEPIYTLPKPRLGPLELLSNFASQTISPQWQSTFDQESAPAVVMLASTWRTQLAECNANMDLCMQNRLSDFASVACGMHRPSSFDDSQASSRQADAVGSDPIAINDIRPYPTRKDSPMALEYGLESSSAFLDAATDLSSNTINNDWIDNFLNTSWNPVEGGF